MSIRSMTGFARADGHDESGYAWTWELKSVNGRGLDVRCRLPSDCDSLEPVVRARVQERFKRGSLTAALQVTRPAGRLRLQLNPEIAEQLEEILGDLSKRVEANPPRLDGLLSIRGVVETVEAEDPPEVRAAREAAMAETLEEALESLARTREEEGARLETVLAGRLDEVARLAAQARDHAALQPDAIKERLRQQVAELMEAAPGLPEERVAQEAALLATRADVREELDRLGAHVSAAHDLLRAGGPAGRRLDFLCQELNREANTMSAKSADIELTRIGLDIKAAVDQLREQVQNVE